MLDADLRIIAEAQLERRRLYRRGLRSELTPLLERALDPVEVRRALLKVQPVVDRLHRHVFAGPDPQELREGAAAAGVLACGLAELNFRRLYPSLDVGIYCDSHRVGKPSVVAPAVVDEHRADLAAHGELAWGEGSWGQVPRRLGDALRELLGDAAGAGIVAWATSADRALRAVRGGLTGRVVEGAETPQAVAAAVTRDTAAVVVRHAADDGQVRDLVTIGSILSAKAPGAALVVDARRTLGVSPVSVITLPERLAVIGSGIGQLRGGSGTGFAWLSPALASELTPSDALVWLDGAVPGALPLAPLVVLLAELRCFASSGTGSLSSAVRRANALLADQLGAARQAAHAAHLSVVGAEGVPRVHLAVDHPQASRVAAALAVEGVLVDGTGGRVRLSGNAASFSYELLYAVERVAAVGRTL